MTELDEIVLVTKMAWALRECRDLEDQDARQWHYESRVGVYINDYVESLRNRLDSKAEVAERQRRRLFETRFPERSTMDTVI